MTEPLTVRTLFDTLHARLRLEWGGGEVYAEEARLSASTAAGQNMVGHLNLIHPYTVQVLGETELRYIQSLDPEILARTLEQITRSPTTLLIVSDGAEVDERLVRAATAHSVPILYSKLDSDSLIVQLQYYLGNMLAEKTVMHGVYMEVMGAGVLITGEVSVGKSELALELISRGHRLIADDAPEFSRIAPDIINGSCPDALREFIEVRGLGVVNVRAMFGDVAVKHNKYLRLIIHLTHMSEEELSQIDRLRGSQHIRKVLGVEVPEITLPVAPGRNLAVLVEIAVRNHMLSMKGYHAHLDFADRQRWLMQQDRP